MNLLNKMTIKNLKLNKKRSIVTIIGIILSVALITAVASIYASGIKSLINFEENEEGNFHIAFYDVPTNDISVFKNNRKIEQLNITKNIGYANIDSQNEYKPYAHIKGFTKDSLNNLSIKLVKGRLPENEDEILIPTHLETSGRVYLDVDKEIELNVGKRVDNNSNELSQKDPYQQEEVEEKIIDTVSKKYKIVGVVERPALNIEKYTAPGFTFITCVDENNLNENVDLYVRYTKEGLKTFNETTASILGIDVSVLNNKNSFEDYQKEMEKAKYEIDTNNYLISLETDPIKNSGLLSAVSIVLGIIVFTSVICIKNSFEISITEKVKQYGIFRSIGATKKQVKRNVFFEATILGLIGIPLGIIFGFLAAYILIIISNLLLANAFSLGFKLVFDISLLSAGIAIILGIVTIYFSAFRGAKKASKVSPIESIRNSANIKINPKKIKSPKIIKKLFGIGGEISIKNIKRNKKKYRTTILSIIVSVFVFIALSSFMSMIYKGSQSELSKYDYNISLSSKQMNDTSYNKIIETTKLENIEDFTVLRNTYIEVKDNPFNQNYLDTLDYDYDSTKSTQIKIVSLGKEQYSKYLKSLGYDYNEMKNKAILVDYEKVNYYDNSKYMRQYKYNSGDIINGDIRSTGNHNIVIGAIVKEKPFGLASSLADFIVVSDEYFDNIETDKSFTIYYKATDANKLQKDIDGFLNGEKYNVNNVNEKYIMIRNLSTLVAIFLYGFIIVISLIGLTNIFNTITTNMELRKPEFAMLKSIGMTTKEFNRMISLESLFIGLKSLFFGIPIGLGLSYMIYLAVTKRSGLPFEFPTIPILIVVCVVFILITLIMKYSISKINKQNTIETIRNENI